MKVVITGASGNVGTALLRRLGDQPRVTDVVGIARRAPDASQAPYDRARWVQADVGDPQAGTLLAEAFAGADAVVHLAWLIQPNRQYEVLRRANLAGTWNVIDAVVRAGVPHLVHASSVGAYAAGPKDRRVGEDWPTTGIPTSHYSRHKALAERQLDDLERRHPDLTVSRLRPGLIFQPQAASEVARYFLGPLVPTAALRYVRPPVLPMPPGFLFQVVHSDDVADAYWRVVERRAPGAYNIAAEPVLGPADVAAALGARHVRAPVPAVRAAAAVTWRLRLQPTDPGWVDMAARAPLMDVARARTRLGWQPRYGATDALRGLLHGLAQTAGTASPPMRPRPL